MMSGTHETHRQASRRRALRNLATFMAGSPLMSLVDANGVPIASGQAGAQGGGRGGRQGAGGDTTRQDGSGRPAVVRPPDYRDEIMKVINLHEFEDAAKKSLSTAAYD